MKKNTMIHFTLHKFESLSPKDLYGILALREEIFTFEQKCTVADLDGLDKNGIHIIGTIENNIVATARILPTGIYKPGKVNFGRLAIKKEYRGKGYGDKLMQIILEHLVLNYHKVPIEISAQYYLKSFYEKHGLIPHGEIYDEGGIPHIVFINTMLNI